MPAGQLRDPPRQIEARSPHTWITMQSQPLPTPTAAVPTTAPPAAARARMLRRPRHPRLRPTRDPHTVWRERETTWTTLPWPVLHASLPEAGMAPFTNKRGEPHPFESAVGLVWPASGALTNAERRAWNHLPLTSSDAEDIIRPQELAAALRDTLEESVLRAPKHWDAGSTALGEWWTLRARYPEPCKPGNALEPVETAISVQHAIGSRNILVYAGLRQPGTGAEIVTGVYFAHLQNGRITLPSRNDYDLVTALSHQARATAAVLASWTEEALMRPALASWAGTVATPAFGHSTAAKLVALHDRRRFSSRLAPDERPAPMDTACDVAWSLADHLRSLPDIERRIDRQHRIIKAVSELCWWNEQGADAPAYAESVH